MHFSLLNNLKAATGYPRVKPNLIRPYLELDLNDLWLDQVYLIGVDMRQPWLLISLLGLSLSCNTSVQAETLMAPSFKDPYKMVPIDGSQNTVENVTSNTSENSTAQENSTNQASAVEISTQDSPLPTLETPIPSIEGDYAIESDYTTANDFSPAYPEGEFTFPPTPANDRYNYSPTTSHSRMVSPFDKYHDNIQQKRLSKQSKIPASHASPNIDSQTYLNTANANTAKALQTLELAQCENANPNAWHKCANFKYHPNGQVRLAEPFVKGELTGWVVQFSPTGTLESATMMKANTKDGIAQGYYPNGAIRNMTSFRKDALHGPEYTFYPNGNVQSTEQYKNGRKHGAYNLYYENGQVMFEANYQNNLLVGASYKYYPNGVMSERLSYSKGKPQGVGQQYYQDGSIKVEAPFVNGIQNGIVKHYTPEGALISETEYVKNQPQGSFTEYYPSGKIKRTATYRLGQLNGESKLYNEQGWLEKEITYVKGEITGEVRTYDHNGTLRERALYQHNRPHGLTTYYDEQGLPWREMTFYNGLAHGPAWLLNQRGELYVRLDFDRSRLINAHCVINKRLLTNGEIQALINHNIMPQCP